MAGETFTESFPAVPDAVAQARNALTNFAREAGADEKQLEAVRLAASEAVTNAVMHAYDKNQKGTVQVSAFRSRFLAEDLRARLGARGLDAYVVSSATEGGQVRYRVRVGAYASRGDAERVAAELRAERTLNPYVTPRAR